MYEPRPGGHTQARVHGIAGEPGPAGGRSRARDISHVRGSCEMRWKLSHIEQFVDVNIVCLVRLEGSLHADQIRTALSRVQRKHPVLRARICKEPDGLYYQADSAPEIPLRTVL